jgi:hypothetical protein
MSVASAPIRTALCLAVLLGSVLCLGCDSIREAVMDPCSSNRKAVRLAENKIAGLRARNVARESPIYRFGVQEVRHTRGILVSCEATYGGGA